MRLSLEIFCITITPLLDTVHRLERILIELFISIQILFASNFISFVFTMYRGILLNKWIAF